MSNNQSGNNPNKNRIISTDVQYGKSYVLPIEQSKVTQSQAKVKKILEETESRAQSIVGNAENKSQIIVETANNEATRIIEDARKKGQQEFDVIKQQAYDDGFAQGQQDGLAKFNEDAEEKLQALEILANSSFEIKNNIINSASNDIVELVVAIAQKVCYQAFNPQMLYQMTLETIKLLEDKEYITIIVSPKLVNSIQQMVPSFRSSIQGLKSLKIKEDDALSADGVIVETPNIRLDSRISSQIGEIAQKMMSGGNNGMG